MTLFLGWLGLIDNENFLKEREEENFLIYKKENMGLVFKGFKIWEEDKIKLLIDGKIINIESTFAADSFEEKIIDLYKNYEEKLLEKLEGYYSLCFMNFHKKNLLLARDIFGSKFLYYFFQKNNLVFSNDLNLLKKFPGIDLSIDKQALYDYLSFFFIPAPLTFYCKIKALLPGEFLQAHLNRKEEIEIILKKYHKWGYFINKNLCLKEGQNRLEELFEDSIKKNLKGKKEIACLLSGGTDSSLTTYFAKKIIKGNVFSFNVKFQEKLYDESADSQKVSNFIGTEHKIIETDKIEKNFEELLKILKIYGQPFADSSLFPSYYILKSISPYKREVLTGEGGDEAFGINPIYLKFSKFSFLPFKNLIYFASLFLSIFKIIPSSYLQKIGEFTSNDIVGNLQTVYSWIRKEEHNKIILFEKQKPLRRHFEPSEGFEKFKGIDLATLISTKNLIENYLPNDFLFKIEVPAREQNITLFHPFLSKELFQFGISLPWRMKREKIILKKLAKKYFPEDIYKKKKKGFGIPFDKWVGEKTKKEIGNYLNHRLNVLKDLLDINILNEWIEAFVNNKQLLHISRIGLYQRIVMLLSLSLYL